MQTQPAATDARSSHWATSVLLPQPAGATTRVSGTVLASSSRPSSASRLTGACRSRGGYSLVAITDIRGCRPVLGVPGRAARPATTRRTATCAHRLGRVNP